MANLELIDAYVAISMVKARYCRFLDTKDWAAFTELFTEDFVLDVSDGTGQPPFIGRDLAIKSVQKSLMNTRTAHQVHSPEINLRGEEADVIWAMQDRVIWERGEGPNREVVRSLTGYGHYHERYVRRGGAWKIAATRLTRLHLDLQPQPSA